MPFLIRWGIEASQVQWLPLARWPVRDDGPCCVLGVKADGPPDQARCSRPAVPTGLAVLVGVR